MDKAHVFISGLVQGVFFRDNTSREAKKRGLTGWVRNTSDGRVETVFEGNKSMIEEVLAWCHQGPSIARVDNVLITWSEGKQEHSSFFITR